MEDLLRGASSVWNGPSTLLAVAPGMAGVFSKSTKADTPSTSESKINSCRIGVDVCPTCVRNWIEFIHSSVVMLKGEA